MDKTKFYIDLSKCTEEERKEKATDLLEAGFPEISAVKDFQSLIQKHKQ